jgi:hypothetical protein
MWKSPCRSRAPAPGLEYRPESAHPRSVENTRALSSRRDMFLDERGTGLRVTWHPERDLVVLSVWQDDRCVGTFRLSVQDVPRLSGLLAAALGDWVGQTGSLPEAGGPGTSGSDPGVPRAGAPGSAGLGTVAVDTTDPGARAGREGGSWRVGQREGREYGSGGLRSAGSSGPVGGSRSGVGGRELSLSVQQRLRLSRPVLKLRGLQDRRRRVG